MREREREREIGRISINSLKTLYVPEEAPSGKNVEMFSFRFILNKMIRLKLDSEKRHDLLQSTIFNE